MWVFDLQEIENQHLLNEAKLLNFEVHKTYNKV